MSEDTGPITGAEVDQGLCVGATTCLQMAPGGFALDRSGRAMFMQGGAWSVEELAEAADECPMGAIKLLRQPVSPARNSNSMLPHHGKVVFITGATRGIGRATAERFAAEGANIVACDLACALADSTADTAGAVRHDAEYLRLAVDVGSQRSLDDAVAEALDRFGKIDIVVANAGVIRSEAFWKMSEENWRSVIDVNLSGVWRTAKAVAPHMIERCAGVILATASVQARSPRKGLCAYTASKHGLLGLVKSLALELGDYNIRVNAVLPGAIHTPMIDNDTAGQLDAAADGRDSPRIAFFRKMSALRNRSVLPASSIAAAFSWLASDAAEHITGVELPVDAGSLILPGLNHAPVID